MDLRGCAESESRFVGYVEGLVEVIGHADRAGPLRDYCLGLLMPSARKSREERQRGDEREGKGITSHLCSRRVSGVRLLPTSH